MIKDKLFGGQGLKGEVGIEIEVEGVHLPHVDSKYWRTEHDGSLKAAEAYEYVLKAPVERDEVNKALASLEKVWKEDKAIINDSFRAGIHVHVNVRDLSVNEMVTFAVLYYIFEDILLKWCGDERVGNHFCLGSKDAEYVLFELEKAIVSGRLENLHSDRIRYSSLNFKALPQYGSLEFRGMRSTKDMAVIEDWVGMLLALKDYAIKAGKPSTIVEEFSLKGTGVLAREVFKGTALKVKQDWKDSMYEGLRRVQSVAYCADWDKEAEDDIHIPYDLDIDVEPHLDFDKVDEHPVAPRVAFDLEALRGARVAMDRAQVIPPPHFGAKPMVWHDDVEED